MNPDQYPPIPAGFHRWEPRPKGWKPGKEVKYAFRNNLLAFPQWQEMPGTAIPLGTPECDYLEAVREPAEESTNSTNPREVEIMDEPAEPSAQLFATLAPDNGEDAPSSGVEAGVCEDSPTPSRYRWTYEGVTFDFYRLCEILDIGHHAQAHALKKVIRAGRGGKTLLQDIDEAIDAMRRFREMAAEGITAQDIAETMPPRIGINQ